MTQIHGRFTWYELMTTDTSAAAAFYGAVAEWGTQDASMAEMQYTLFTSAGAPVCGLMQQPDAVRASGILPIWFGYVTVDDVDATTDQVRQLGGSVHVEPRDIPGVGRFSMIADPQGAAIGLLRWADDKTAVAAPPQTPGRVGWNELLAVDWPQAFEFYRGLFGWTKAEAVDIGEMGTYQLFSAGDHPIGGMFTKPPMVPVPYWLYYVAVTDIDAAVARVQAAGGLVVNGPMQVPGGSWIVQAKDPQGAMFALVGSRA